MLTWLRVSGAGAGVMYLGNDSTGFCRINPRRAAAFSPCRPNPCPAFSVLLHDPAEELVSWRIMWGEENPFSLGDEKIEATLWLLTKTGRLSWEVGRTPLASARQEVMERLGLADSRKRRPRSMLRHPRAKRKKADTRVKSSTWWDRIWVEILERENN